MLCQWLKYLLEPVGSRHRFEQRIDLSKRHSSRHTLCTKNPILTRHNPFSASTRRRIILSCTPRRCSQHRTPFAINAIPVQLQVELSRHPLLSLNIGPFQFSSVERPNSLAVRFRILQTRTPSRAAELQRRVRAGKKSILLPVRRGFIS